MGRGTGVLYFFASREKSAVGMMNKEQLVELLMENVEYVVIAVVVVVIGVISAYVVRGVLRKATRRQERRERSKVGNVNEQRLHRFKEEGVIEGSDEVEDDAASAGKKKKKRKTVVSAAAPAAAPKEAPKEAAKKEKPASDKEAPKRKKVVVVDPTDAAVPEHHEVPVASSKPAKSALKKTAAPAAAPKASSASASSSSSSGPVQDDAFMRMIGQVSRLNPDQLTILVDAARERQGLSTGWVHSSGDTPRTLEDRVAAAESEAAELATTVKSLRQSLETAKALRDAAQHDLAALQEQTTARIAELQEELRWANERVAALERGKAEWSATEQVHCRGSI